jgi:hypothetical protein
MLNLATQEEPYEEEETKDEEFLRSALSNL